MAVRSPQKVKTKMERERTDEERERDLLDRSVSLETADEYREWERLCDDFLDVLREKCRTKRQRTFTGPYFSQIARIVRLEGHRNTVRQRFERIGDGRVERRGFSWTEVETAFERRVLTGAVVNTSYIEPLTFLQDAMDTVLDQIRNVLAEYNAVKVNTAFNGEFVSGEKISVKAITTKNHPLFRASDLTQWYETLVIEPILASLEEFQERDSGWALSRILNLTVNVNKYNPMRAGCRAEIPREIQLKKAVVNVYSNENKCFAWAVVAALYPTRLNVNKMSSYPFYRTVLNLEGINFPMTLDQITKFERLNDISVNVFTIEENPNKKNKNHLAILPLRLTNDKRDRHANLLYVLDSPPDNNVGHFVCIKNLSRLVGSQLSAAKVKTYICDR